MEDNNKIIKQLNLDEIIGNTIVNVEYIKNDILNDLSKCTFDQYQAMGWYSQCISEEVIKFKSWDHIIDYIKTTYYQIKSHNFYSEYECGEIYMNIDFGYEFNDTFLTPGEEDNINNHGIKELIIYCFNTQLELKMSLAEYIHGIAYFHYCLLNRMNEYGIIE